MKALGRQYGLRVMSVELVPDHPSPLPPVEEDLDPNRTEPPFAALCERQPQDDQTAKG
jgi:hypothetical protein